MTAEEVLDLLDSDGKDEYLEDADLEEIIFPGSDNELGFEEVVVGNGSNSESEDEDGSDKY